eukprot:TRINITY_DN4191_c0_g1_i3.p1 TRINITY_DN4191_c0_g1~~TRINITY_DN4191_c0_g1_i3.p1  ORF type:complete len:302 (-),score=83.97 TRINITY_DN4191_c0_g1_i3:161-1066(-)
MAKNQRQRKGRKTTVNKRLKEESDEYEVEEILDCRNTSLETEYLVKWKDWADKYNSWVKESDMDGCRAMIQAYKLAHLEGRRKRKRVDDSPPSSKKRSRQEDKLLAETDNSKNEKVEPEATEDRDKEDKKSEWNGEKIPKEIKKGLEGDATDMPVEVKSDGDTITKGMENSKALGKGIAQVKMFEPQTETDQIKPSSLEDVLKDTRSQKENPSQKTSETSAGVEKDQDLSGELDKAQKRFSEEPNEADEMMSEVGQGEGHERLSEEPNEADEMMSEVGQGEGHERLSEEPNEADEMSRRTK